MEEKYIDKIKINGEVHYIRAYNKYVTFEMIGNGQMANNVGTYNYVKDSTWREFVESEDNPIYYEDARYFSVDGDMVLWAGWGQIFGSTRLYKEGDYVSDMHDYAENCGYVGRPVEQYDVLPDDIITYPYYWWLD